jgi:hypothetical protein
MPAQKELAGKHAARLRKSLLLQEAAPSVKLAHHAEPLHEAIRAEPVNDFETGHERLYWSTGTVPAG